MGEWQEIPLESAANVGSYRLELVPVFGFGFVPSISTPKAWVIGSYVGRLDAWYNDYVNGVVVAEFTISKVSGATGEWRPVSGRLPDTVEVIPFLAIAGAIAALAGLTLVYLTVSKVYQLVESPAGAAFSWGFLIVAALVAIVLVPKLVKAT